MPRKTNYSELTDEMTDVFHQVKNNKMNTNKANTLVRASNSIINIQRAKILSTAVNAENELPFFKD